MMELSVSRVRKVLLSKHQLEATLMEEVKTGSFLCSSLSVFRAVRSIKQMKTNTESTDSTSINQEAILPFTSCAYAADARLMKVRGKELAHHATVNLLMDFLNRAGLNTCFHVERPTL